MKIRFLLFGVGQVGSLIAEALTRRSWAEIVGAVDVDERKVGRDLGEVAGLGFKLGVRVSKSLKELRGEADIAVHATGSRLSLVADQLLSLISEGLNVVSTCEELAYPYVTYESLASKLDEEARRFNVRVLGTGVNPGFALDTLPLVATAPCVEVEEIEAYRLVDVSKRRKNLQRKVGLGLTVEEFRRGYIEGWIGHVGLKESTYLIAEGLGWRLDRVEESIEPVERKARVIGLKQEALGYVDGKAKIRLYLEMTSTTEDRGLVKIRGYPNLEFEVKTGIPGDVATAGMIINAAAGLLKTEPGLRTMLDLPTPRAYLQL